MLENLVLVIVLQVFGTVCMAGHAIVRYSSRQNANTTTPSFVTGMWPPGYRKKDIVNFVQATINAAEAAK